MIKFRPSIGKFLTASTLVLGLILGSAAYTTTAQYGGYTTVAPQYTTVNLPTCSSSVNAGALAWDTTTTSFKICDGSGWVESGTFGATSVSFGTGNRVKKANAGATDLADSLIIDDGVTVTLPATTIMTGITANTYVKMNAGGTTFEDGLLTDDGTDITMAAGTEFNVSDGTTGDDVFIYGIDEDFAVYFDNTTQFMMFDGSIGTGSVIIEWGDVDGNAFGLRQGGNLTHTFAGVLSTTFSNPANMINLGLGRTIGNMDASDTWNILRVDVVNGNHTGTANTLNLFFIDDIAGDANSNLNAINIGALTGTTGAAGEVETAVNVGAGWDYGLSILGDGSAVINNITLGLSQTADVQLYFDNAGFVIDLDGTAGNTMDFQIDGDAAASRSLLSLTGTFGLLDSSDTQRGLYLNLANANHTGTSNIVTAFEIAAVTGDAQATETGIIVGAGYDLAARFDKPVHKLAYRQDFDGPCRKKERADFTQELVTNASINAATCPGDINVFTYRLDGDQATPFLSIGGALDIDNDGIENEGVEIRLQDGDGSQGWVLVGTSVAKYFRASVTITSVSGTDNFYIGWLQAEAFVDNLVIATYDTYAVHLINDVAGNLQIQTGDDTADGTDENDQVAAFGDGETHIFEVRVATDGGFTFFIDDLQVTESSATGAAAAGEVLVPFIGLLNAADADTETKINWIEVGEII